MFDPKWNPYTTLSKAQETEEEGPENVRTRGWQNVKWETKGYV